MNRIFELAIGAIAFGILSGCYESNALLLDVSAARQPVTSYDDWRYTSGGTTYHARLNPRSDGWYEYERAAIQDDGSEGEWEHHTVLLNYLQNSAGLDVYVYATWDDMENAYVYGLVAFSSDGYWQSILPDCDMMADERYAELDLNAAQSAGAEMASTDMADVCVFKSGDNLFSAMRTIAYDSGFRQRVDDAAK